MVEGREEGKRGVLVCWIRSSRGLLRHLSRGATYDGVSSPLRSYPYLVAMFLVGTVW